MDNESVSIYAIANQLIVAVSMFIPIFQRTIYPILVENKHRLEETFIKYNGMITWFYIIIIPFSCVFVYSFFDLVYNEEYERAITVYFILSLGVLFSANASLRVAYLTIENKTKVLMYVALLGTVVNVVANYFLILNVGLLGASIATVVTQFITSNLIYLFFKKYRFIAISQIRSVFFFL